MGKKCFVPNCKSGYDSSPRKYSLYKVPTCETARKKWADAVSRTGRALHKSAYFCERHFLPHEIVREKVISAWNGIVIQKVKLQRTKLLPDAVPSIFENWPKHLLGDVMNNEPSDDITDVVKNEPPDDITDVVKNEPPDDIVDVVKNELPDDEQPEEILFVNCETNSLTITEQNYSDKSQLLNHIDQSILDEDNMTSQGNLFDNIWINPCSVKLPTSLWSYHKSNIETKKMIVYSTMRKAQSGLPEYFKQVVLEPGFVNPKVIIMNKVMTIEEVGLPVNYGTNCEEMGVILDVLNSKRLCPGGPKEKQFPSSLYLKTAYVDQGIWRHLQCTTWLWGEEYQCRFCRRLDRNLCKTVARRKSGVKPRRIMTPNVMSEESKQAIDKLRRVIRLGRKARARLSAEIDKLRSELLDT